MKTQCYISVDIGGSKLATGLVTATGEIYAVEKHVWQSYESEQVLRKIIKSIHTLIEKNSQDKDFLAIGVNIPGFADPKEGIWISATFMGIYQVPIRTILETEFSLPVFIEKDTNSCCLAEKIFGACKYLDDYLYMTVSNGIGGAMFLNGELYYGAHGFAGEYGMCVVEEDGRPLKNHTMKGCLEAYASGRGLVETYLNLAPEDAGKLPEINGQTLLNIADQGDFIAKQTFMQEGYYLSKIIASACNMMDPQKVIIGGGLSLAYRAYEAALEDGLNRFHYKQERWKELFSIEPTPLGYNGGLFGAATVAILGLQRDIHTKWGYRG